MDPESAGALAAVTHGDAIAGEVSHAGLGEGGDGQADLFVDAHFHAVFLTEAMAAALAVRDEFLEDGIHVGGAENPEEVEFLHALVGMDIDRPVGAHLDVRDPQFAADAEDDAQQVGAAHAGQETHRCGCRGMTRKWRWFEDGGEDGHGEDSVGGLRLGFALVAQNGLVRSVADLADEVEALVALGDALRRKQVPIPG